MAFTVRNLSVLAYANGFTLWHYKITEALPADELPADYFASAADLFSPGDIMCISYVTKEKIFGAQIVMRDGGAFSTMTASNLNIRSL